MALPTELDFGERDVLTKDRLDTAFDYIVRRFRAVESLNTSLDTAIDAVRELGLSRLNEVLTPIFAEVNTLNTQLQSIKDAWQSPSFINALKSEVQTNVTASVTSSVTAAFADYRNRYLGAKTANPTTRDDGSIVGVGDMYFNVTTDTMMVLGAGGWRNAGSVLTTLVKKGAYTATGGETTITVSGGYDPGYIDVYVNGLALSPGDMVITSGTAIVLPAALSAGDEVSWTAFSQLTVANTYSKAEVDAANAAQDAARVAAISGLSATYYNKTQVDSAFSTRDATISALSGSLSGNYYTKAQIDEANTTQTSSLASSISTVQSNLTAGLAAQTTARTALATLIEMDDFFFRRPK